MKTINGASRRNLNGERGINTARFLGYDKNEYGDLIVNRKEAEIVKRVFDLYLMNIGFSRLGQLLKYLKVPTVAGGAWEGGILSGMVSNEKYKGDSQLQKDYTPADRRNQTKRNLGEVQSYYITEKHKSIVDPEVWQQAQEMREYRKKKQNIGQDTTQKYTNRYPLNGRSFSNFGNERPNFEGYIEKALQLSPRVKLFFGLQIFS